MNEAKHVEALRAEVAQLKERLAELEAAFKSHRHDYWNHCHRGSSTDRTDKPNA